jgi:hypothetical protein
LYVFSYNKSALCEWDRFQFVDSLFFRLVMMTHFPQSRMLMTFFRTVCNVATMVGRSISSFHSFTVAVAKCCNAVFHLQTNHCNACGIINVGLSVDQQFLRLLVQLPSSYCAERTSPVPAGK